MLDGVGEALAADEVGRCLDLSAEPLARRVHLDGDRRSARELVEGGCQPAIQLRRREPACELAQLLDRDGDLGDRALEGLAGTLRRRRPELVLGVAEREPDRDEPLLGSVVKVSLEPAPCVVLRRTEDRPPDNRADLA